MSQSARYRYTPKDSFSPRGPDGGGWNRINLGGQFPTPQARCLLLPTCYESAWESQHRPYPRFEPAWHLYEPCRGSDCVTCPVAARRAPSRPIGPGVIRVDDKGRPWAMNRQDRGWGEFGYQYRSWGDLLASLAIVLGRRGQDPHGEYVAFEPGGAR